VSWMQTVVSALSALGGGFVGGWLVAFRLGGWRQRTEDRLEHLEERQARADRALDAIPVVRVRADLILEELRTMRGEMRSDRKNFVTHEECDRRHKHA